MDFKKFDWFGLSKGIALLIVVIFCLIMVTDFFKHQNSQQIALQEKIVEISNNAILHANISPNDASVTELKKMFEEQNSQILAKYNEEREKTKEALAQIGNITAELQQTRRLYVSSDKIYKKDTQDPKRWYFFKKLTVTGPNGDEIPVAWAMFYPYQTPDKQWKYGTYELNVDVKAIQTENRDGSFNQYAEVDIIDKDGLELPVENINVEWAKVRIKDKQFDWWNPTLALGASFVDTLDAGLNMSIISYGKTDVDIDWRFITFGAGMSDENWYMTFEPLGYNVGKKLPLVKNLFIGPIMKYTFDEIGKLSYGIQISVPF